MSSAGEDSPEPSPITTPDFALNRKMDMMKDNYDEPTCHMDYHNEVSAESKESMTQREIMQVTVRLLYITQLYNIS